MFVEYSIYFQIVKLSVIHILLKAIRFLGSDSAGKSHWSSTAFEALHNYTWTSSAAS